MPATVAVKHRHIKAPFPAWTAIQVARLIPDNGITEIRIVAKLPSAIGAGKGTPNSSPGSF